ncbi:beta-ketoacyl-[acyl-carrier-protein] synthase family protein [Bordetella genomosp. 12]|uniref:Nodulation protein E n=1 Tax=Bordetella genomosp. 12 TaxID=463035 RepID=A0A261VVH8_9BORD|nr:beta-ketoacyl-[acyl-carrier-protein] synthase family protein [Bordetella genomosp. 12]OZI77303.1 3-oxoacyl-ACP synthase [Bordetella genomosp. 12]
MTKRRVVITAMGMVTPLGATAQETFAAALAGRCGLIADPSGRTDRQVGIVTAPVTDFVAASQARNMDRVTLLADSAARETLQAARLDEDQMSQCGVFIGTGVGGVSTLSEAVEIFHHVTPKRAILVIPAVMANAPAAHLAQSMKSMAEAQTYATACSAGAVAIGEAFRRIRDGYLDLALAGGVESMMVAPVISGWQQLHVLCGAPEAGKVGGCRPFSLKRSGFALSEGAGLMMLESEAHATARGATIIAEICGYGTSNDGTHPLRPDSRGQSLAMSRCLADAGIAPEEVGYLNAHATGTLLGDRIETEAIKQVFGAHASDLPISSTKGALGHLIGAAGAVEAAITALAVQARHVPPTLYWEAGDEHCDLDYIPEGSRSIPTLRTALSNSFGMGGNNAVLAFRGASSG